MSTVLYTTKENKVKIELSKVLEKTMRYFVYDCEEYTKEDDLLNDIIQAMKNDKWEIIICERYGHVENYIEYFISDGKEPMDAEYTDIYYKIQFTNSSVLDKLSINNRHIYKIERI